MKIFRIIFITFLINNMKSLDSNIVFVYEHVRHGARSPLFFDGNTDYLDRFGTQWEGAMELTNVGKREHYVLGIHNRLKYSSLINFTKYDYQEIKVYSTNTGRTVQSIQAELLAMYLPGTLPKLTKDQLKAAYPPFQNLSLEVLDEISELNDSTIINDINIFPIQYSDPKKVQINEPANCPYMKQYQEDLKTNSVTVKDFVSNFISKYGDKLKEVLNITDKELNDFEYIETILAEEVLCNYYDGNKLTDFFRKTGFNESEFIQDNRLSKSIYTYNINLDEKTGIMSASPSMKEIINYMDNIINNKSQAPKMVMQGGHDTTISYIQYFMKHVFNIPIQYISFASNIYFELHKNKSESELDKYYIEYILDGITKLIMDYPEFQTKVLDAVWSDEDINKFCYPPEKEDITDEKTDENKTEYEKYKTYTIALLSTTIFLFISTVVFLALFIVHYKQYKTFSGNSITNDSILNGKKNNEMQLIE